MEHFVLQDHDDKSFWSAERVAEIIESHPVVVFGKSRKRCGITSAIEHYLDAAGVEYKKIDISENRFVAAAVRKHSGERLLPVVFVDNVLVREGNLTELAQLLSH